VTVVTLVPQTVTLKRELPGRVTPFLVAEVRPQVNGIVARRLFTEGGLVKAGQPLYQIEDATYRADGETAAASLARAEATLVTTQLNARRSAELLKVDAVSKQEDEDAAAALRQAEADVKAARAAVTRADVVLGYARIIAPISGRIGKSTVTQGALVTANQAAPLATVQQLDPVYVDVTQSAAELLELRRALAAGTLKGTRNLPVRILLEDGTPFEHDGQLAFSDVTVEPSTGSFALRIVVPNPANVLLPGMYVRAVIGDGERENALLAPQQGVTHDPKGDSTALVVGPDGTVELRKVTVSRAIGDQWLVEDGLVAGDRVIIEGLQKIKPGAPVQAIEAGTAAAPTAAPPQPRP
jgi:membrane fusion protein (multidrug efflux system)